MNSHTGAVNAGMRWDDTRQKHNTETGTARGGRGGARCVGSAALGSGCRRALEEVGGKRFAGRGSGDERKDGLAGPGKDC